MKKRVGFTLAEVLITLTIIGVVAAITLPAINSSTGAARTRSLLKKGMTTLNNAVMMNVATNEWSFADLEAIENIDDIANLKNHNSQDNRTIVGMLNGALVGETLQGSPVYADATNKDGKYVFPESDQNYKSIGSAGGYISWQLSDGMVIAMQASAELCNEDKRKEGPPIEGGSISGYCRGFIDINGNKGPNQVITCQTGTTMIIVDEDNEDYSKCTVANNPNADIFPVVFYDSTVELASNAAKVFFNN